MIFLPSQITLSNGWQPLGLRATASQDMIVRDAFVPFERTFSLDTPIAEGPLYHYPFHQQAEAVLSVTLLGMAAHFLELFEARILVRFPRAEPVLAESLAAIAATRTVYYDTVRAAETSWAPYTLGRSTAGGCRLRRAGGNAESAALRGPAVSVWWHGDDAHAYRDQPCLAGHPYGQSAYPAGAVEIPYF